MGSSADALVVSVRWSSPLPIELCDMRLLRYDVCTPPTRTSKSCFIDRQLAPTAHPRHPWSYQCKSIVPLQLLQCSERTFCSAAHEAREENTTRALVGVYYPVVQHTCSANPHTRVAILMGARRTRESSCLAWCAGAS